MQSISKFNEGSRFLLCVIGIFSKYAWVVPLKDKKEISIVNAFKKPLKQSNRKPNKMHYKCMTLISKNVYIDKLDAIANEHNNKHHNHTAIKMKPVDVKENRYIKIDKEINDKDPKFQVGDHITISKYKSIFAKGYTLNWSEEIIRIKRIKNIVPWTYVINDLNGEEIIGTFYEKDLQKKKLRRI